MAVIPARSGSKRLPGKNIRPLLGKPLIVYAVEAARASELFSLVLVTTDSKEIAALARDAGAEAPFLRSADLADDLTPVSLATADALERIDPGGNAFGSVAQLMPNCPLRSAADLRDSFAQFQETGATSQISVTRYGWLNPWWAMRRDRSLALQPLFPDQGDRRSQEMDDLFCPTGAVWWARCEALRRERTFHLQGRTGWEIPWHRAVDIDTEEDWRLAEVLMRAQVGASS